MPSTNDIRHELVAKGSVKATIAVVLPADRKATHLRLRSKPTARSLIPFGLRSPPGVRQLTLRVSAVNRHVLALTLCARCRLAYDPYALESRYCSAECEAASCADRERRERRVQKAKAWVVVILSSCVIVMGVASNIHDYLRMAAQLERSTFHVEHVAAAAIQAKTASRDAFVAATNGVSEVAYPTIGAFCRALRLKGQAERTVSDQDLMDKEAAIDISLGARYVSAGDLVEVFNDMSTTCYGQLRRLPERVSLIRDVRSGVSGWVVSHALSNG